MASPKKPAAAIPVFNLYGEDAPWPTPDLVHVESIATRSKLHEWQIRPHRHNGLFQILYLTGGRASVQLEDRRLAMGPGQLLLVPQMCVHGFEFERNADGHVVTLAYALTHRLARSAGDDLAALAVPSLHKLKKDHASQHIKASFEALREEYRATEPFRHVLIEALLAAILIWLARHQPDYRHAPARQGEGMRAAQHFRHFCDLIETHYAEQQPVAWYAARIGITAAHLNALCRQKVGKSALELVHARVLLEAKRNLVYTSMSVAVVSYTVGFADPAYFTRFFKRQTGMAPMAFRAATGQASSQSP